MVRGRRKRYPRAMARAHVVAGLLLHALAGCGDETAAPPKAPTTPMVPVPRPVPLPPESLGPGPRALPTGGTEFRVWAPNASRIELWTFAAPGDVEPSGRHVMQRSSVEAGLWSVEVAGAGPGTLYGLRAWGPNWRYDPSWEPGSRAGFIAHVDDQGHRYNPNKLLMDPYARALTGEVRRVREARTGFERYDSTTLGGNDAHGFEDSAAAMPRSLVVDERFDWAEDARPGTPAHDSVVYEVHLRGFSRGDPATPEPLRGTYDGLAQNVDHLVELGVTAVELLPIHEFDAWDDPIASQGAVEDRRNYWGYMSKAYFAPNRDYLCPDLSTCAAPLGAEVGAMKRLVRALHRVGIEVWLDVVFNHTGEGGVGPDGSTRYFSFRGLDNRSYYTLSDDPRYYWDTTGTGNNLNASSHVVRRLVMDSLRYWIDEVHVDGFRFDLAYTLGRVGDEGRVFDPRAPLLLDIAALGREKGVKMVAEAWDAAGYGVGAFPDGWMEWDGRWRDTVRRFVKGDAGQAGPMGQALTASHEGFERPSGSVGYVTAHDGFTLNDLVSYDHKLNGRGPCNPTGADPNSGSNDNASWSHDGDERLRARQVRNFFAQLFLQQGVPMVLGGDELRRTQHGNNNAYMADNPCGWLNWTPTPKSEATRRWVAGLARLRAGHPALGRDRPLTGEDRNRDGRPDIQWWGVEGTPDWSGSSRSVAFVLDGSAAETGVGTDGPDLFVAMNAGWQDSTFRLPPAGSGQCWDLVFDTAGWAEPAGNLLGADLKGPMPSVAGSHYGVGARSTVVLAARACEAPEATLLTIEASGVSTEVGERVLLVGELDELGGWDPERGLPLVEVGPGRWRATHPVVEARGRSFRCKLVVAGARAIRWEAGDDRTLEVSAEPTARVELRFRGG